MKLSVLQWNILYNEEPGNVAATISKLDPDVICLQEVADRPGFASVPDSLGQSLKCHVYYQAAHTWQEDEGDRKAGESIGNAIFSRWPITRQKHVVVRNDTWEDRIYIAAATGPPGAKPITVGTTHLTYTPRFANPSEAEADKVLAQVRNKRYVLTGDLNALPDSKLIKGLEQKLTHAGPAYAQKTWTTKPVDFMGFKTDKLNWRLDYIFVSPDIKVKSSRIVDTPYSDHLPVLAELEV